MWACLGCYSIHSDHCWCVEARESHVRDEEIMPSGGGKQGECRGPAAILGECVASGVVGWCWSQLEDLSNIVFSLSWS